MRVVSQDGTVDAPYERVLITFGFNGNKTEYHVNGHLLMEEKSSFVKLAAYSTEEKAKRAMGELQYAYSCREIYKRDKNVARHIPTDEMKRAIIGGVFQFPAEEELE